MNEFFTTANIILSVLIYFAGVALSVAAFGKLYSKRYVSDEDRYVSIGLSLILWPICLILIFATMLFQRANK